VYLFELADSRCLQMGTKKLAEGWRSWWILKGCRGEVETGGFRVAGDEESVCPSRRANLQHQRAIRRLVNFLNPPARKDRGDLFDDGSKFCHSQRHNLSISDFSRPGYLMREDPEVREAGPRGHA
jgi:hypothetical protein